MSETSDKTAAYFESKRFFSRAWRLIATGISFLLFGIGGLVVGMIIAPVLWLVVREPLGRERLIRRLISYGCYAFVEVMRLLGVMRYTVHGRESHQVDGGCLIVANHPTLVDVVFLLALYPEADCVVKAALWANPCMMIAVRVANFIPNRDPVAVMEMCLQRLGEGRKLILFPEGTRTKRGIDPDFKRGAASIALRAGVPCLPVILRCRPLTLTKADPWYRVPERRVLYEVMVLEPVDTTLYIQNGVKERAASHLLNADLQRLCEPAVQS